MSTTSQLLSSDLTEDYYRRLRFRQSSSLPVREKIKLQPYSKPYRRDRVLRRIIQMNLETAIVRIGQGDGIPFYIMPPLKHIKQGTGFATGGYSIDAPPLNYNWQNGWIKCRGWTPLPKQSEA